MSANAATEVQRCRRCGTKLRHERPACPSCGWDFQELPEEPAAGSGEQPHVIKKVAAKAGVKMCAVCMATVPEDQIVEHDGQKICPVCFEGLKNKAAKKAAGT